MRPGTQMAATASDERLMDLSAEVRRVVDCPYTPSLQVCVYLPTLLPYPTTLLPYPKAHVLS